MVYKDIYIANNLIKDSYGNCVVAGKHYLKAHFSVKENIVKNGYTDKVNEKDFTIFFKESILYPFVRF